MESIADAISLLEKCIITGEEFNTLVEGLIEKSDGMVSGIYYKCTHATFEGAVALEYGKCGESEATSTKKFDLGNNVSCNVSLWCQGDSIKEETVIDLFKAFWNCNYADDISGILCSDKAVVKKKCSETLKRYFEREKNVAIFMMDLDNFKEVNDMNSHEFGDQVIREATNVMLDIIGKKGILIHQSGDEFNVIFPYDKPVEILKLGKNISFGVKSRLENRLKKGLTMSIGVWLPKLEDTDFDKALSSAEQMYFPKGKNVGKQRDSIRIGKDKECQTLGMPSMELGISRVKSNIYTEGIFHNIYLDFLSDFLGQIKDYHEIKQKIKDVIEWINPSWNSGFYCSRDTIELSTSEMLAPEEVGLAFVYGLLKNGSLTGKKIKIDLDKSKIRVCLDGEEIFCEKKAIDGTFSDECVIPEYNSNQEVNVQTSKKIVLVQAGYEKTNIPTDVFYHVIKVDNRPYIGGGLPDFWAAALCDLIADGKRNPNFKKIIVFGDTDNTAKIKRYLENIEKWDNKENEFSYEYISRKTYKSVNDIMIFQNKYKEQVVFAKSSEDLIKLIYQEYQGNLDPCMLSLENGEEPRRFLNRRLSYDNLQLKLCDGCRVESLSDAYPTVLEILRNSSDSKGYKGHIN